MSRNKAAPKTPRRPTLRLVAEAAGVSLATASMALRNHPDTSAATAGHVKKVAHRLGYRPDPKIAMLMQHLRTQGDADYHETIAYLSPYSDYRWKKYSQHDYYMGACERASELGYRVEIFHLGEPGMTPHRMSDLLLARGIRGLLVAGSETPDARLEMTWKDFAAVTFSYSLSWPLLHRATTDYYREMVSTLDRLKKEGFRRIGLNVRVSNDSKAGNFWRSAYLFHTSEVPPDDQIPVNILHTCEESLVEWTQTHRPDAIISAGCDFPQDYERIHRMPPPKGIRYVNMNIFTADARSRGIDQNSHAVGRLACGHLVTLLQRNEIGLPDQPQVLSIEGKWVEDYDAWWSGLGKHTKPSLQQPGDSAASIPKASARR